MQILRRRETLSSTGGAGYQGSYFSLHEVPVGAVLLAGIVTEMTPSHDSIFVLDLFAFCILGYNTLYLSI